MINKSTVNERNIIILKDNDITKSLLQLSKETIISALKTIKSTYGLIFDDQIDKVPKQKLLHIINECISYSAIDEFLLILEDIEDSLSNSNRITSSTDIVMNDNQNNSNDNNNNNNDKDSNGNGKGNHNSRVDGNCFYEIVVALGSHSQLITHPYLVNYKKYTSTSFEKTIDPSMVKEQIEASNQKILFFQSLSSLIKLKGINNMFEGLSSQQISQYHNHIFKNIIIKVPKDKNSSKTQPKKKLKYSHTETTNTLPLLPPQSIPNSSTNDIHPNNDNNDNNNNNNINKPNNDIKSKIELIDEIKEELIQIGTESFLKNLTSPTLKMMADNLKLNKFGSKDFIMDQLMCYLFPEITYERSISQNKWKKKRRKQRFIPNSNVKVNYNYNNYNYKHKEKSDDSSDSGTNEEDEGELDDEYVEEEENIEDNSIVELSKEDNDAEEDEDEDEGLIESDGIPRYITKDLTKEELYGYFRADILKAFCKTNNLKASGNKKMVIKRIMSFLQGNDTKTSQLDVIDTNDNNNNNQPQETPKKKRKKKRKRY